MGGIGILRAQPLVETELWRGEGCLDRDAEAAEPRGADGDEQRRDGLAPPLQVAQPGLELVEAGQVVRDA